METFYEWWKRKNKGIPNSLEGFRVFSKEAWFEGQRQQCLYFCPDVNRPPNQGVEPKQAKGCELKNMCGSFVLDKCGEWYDKYPPEG